MNTTMKAQNVMSTNRKYVLFAAIILAAIASWFALKEPASHSTGAPTVAPAGSTGSLGKSATSIIKSRAQMAARADTTYRPGQTRAIQQYIGTIDSKSITSDWWLYARSEDEALWMDFYGYPTPTEEARLRAMSEANLKLLADAGDMNAKAHYWSRAMIAAFDKNDLQGLNIASGQIGEILLRGAAYQAMTVMQGYGKLLVEYKGLPESERTEERIKMLKQFGVLYNLAQIQGEIYGDLTVRTMEQQISNIAPGITGQTMTMTIPGVQIGYFVANSARQREQMGLPPLMIKVRPEAPEGGAPIYLERK